MILNELFNKTYDWDKNELNKDVPQITFSTEQGQEFQVEIFIYNGECEFEFSVMVPWNDHPHAELDSLPPGVAKDMKRPAQHVTGGGDQFKVFATIVDIVRTLLDKRDDIEKISFSADEPSRQKLYDRFAKMFQREGWSVETRIGPDGTKRYECTWGNQHPF